VKSRVGDARRADLERVQVVMGGHGSEGPSRADAPTQASITSAIRSAARFHSGGGAVEPQTQAKPRASRNSRALSAGNAGSILFRFFFDR
jgi:hypothetical protein